MREFYTNRYLFWLIIGIIGAVSCHQEPIVPASAIPLTCQIYRIANINEGARDTTVYTYDSFGHLTESRYRQWVNGQLVTALSQRLSYSSDHFLITQTITYAAGGSQNQPNRTYKYTYQDEQLQQVDINNTQSGQPVGFLQYIYENGRVKTYIETNAQKIALKTYTFDGMSKLVQYVEPGVNATITNGKITKRVQQDGMTTTYQFDQQGQLQSEVIMAGITRTERTYAYDNKPYWNKTQLLFRGIPTPDLGGYSFIHNVTENSVKQTQNERIIQDQRFSYQLKYTDTGYVLGYARSDGAQQRIVYTSCL